jgi:hypothetical protein
MRRIHVLPAFVALAVCSVPFGVVRADAEPSPEAKLEAAVAASPDNAAAWVALAKSFDARGDQVPAVLCYARALVCATPPPDAKAAAERVWAMTVPPPGKSPGKISMRPPATDDDPWWQLNLLLVTLTSVRHGGKAAAMTDDEFFATSIEGLAIFIEGSATNDKLDAFWRELVIPYFNEAVQKKYVESMAYDMVRALGRPATARWIETHKETVDAFRAWSNAWRPSAPAVPSPAGGS